jgi:hypothetical protein
MGVFDFLKKSKADTTDTGMDLPPVPKMEGTEFPEMKEEKVPPLPETSLPPLPSEVPGELPPAPEITEMESPKVEMPEAPKIEAAEEKIEAVPAIEEEIPGPPAVEEEITPEKAEAAPKPEFPKVPETVSEVVPDRIPPLEGLPEAPEFKPEEVAETVEKPAMPGPAMPQPAPAAPAEAPPTYAAEPVEPPKKVMRGPLFIRTDRFKTVLEDIELIRTKFKEEDDIFFRINDIKGAQDQKFEDFKKSLEDIQRKLLFIDRSLFEAK